MLSLDQKLCSIVFRIQNKKRWGSLFELYCVTLKIMSNRLLRANFLYDVRYQEGHPVCKISSVNIYPEVKVRAQCPLEGTNNRCHELSVLISNISLL